MPGPESAIPVGSQFSPDLVDLPAFLASLIAHSGNKVAIEAAVETPGVRKRARSAAPTRRTGSLPVEAARQYGLLDDDYVATSLAQRLASLSMPAVYEEFARHILLERGGLRVIEGIREMTLDHRPITGDSLAQYLTDQGFRVNVHNTAINSLRMWLAAAGVFPIRGWTVDTARVERLVGLSTTTIAALVGLNDEQRAFVEALCRLNPTGSIPAADVRTLAATILGRSFGQASLPQSVLEPLKRAGLIDYATRGTRAGKSSTLQTTPAFTREVLEPFITRTVKTLDAVLTAYFTKSAADIYRDLGSGDAFVKGQGLEAFAIYVMRLLGLRFAGWRVSGSMTGGTEIDALMTGLTGLQPTTWQVQCKNTPSGTLRAEAVAKEVGLLPLTNATNILVLANCHVTQDAGDYARRVMRNSPVNIYLIDKEGFGRMRQRPTDLAAILLEQGERIRQLRHEATVAITPGLPVT